MVLQALRTIFLSSLLFTASISSEMSDCVTTTELDFTEKEACHLNSLVKSMLMMSGNNFQFLVGASSGVMRESIKFKTAGKSGYRLAADLDKAKALMLEKSSSDVKSSVNLLLTDAEIRILIAQVQKVSIENQTILNEHLLKRNR